MPQQIGYKYPFHEQVLIHAQRPDAKACAPIELWNNTFRRWVNKGAKGIAIIDDSGQKPSLRYVFDVSDTNARHSIPFRLWQMQAAHEEQVVEELANHFGEIDAYAELPFSDQITGIVHNAVNDNLTDYANDLIALDRYLSEKEKAYLPAWEQEEAEKQLQRAEEAAVREALRAAAAAMDERRKDAEYRFSLGTEVQLGAQTYTILGYDNETVILSNPRFPLLSDKMPRDVFERRLRENEANDHLIVEQTAQETPAPVNVNSIDDMTQLEREEALQLFDEGELIYLYDNERETEVIAETREEIWRCKDKVPHECGRHPHLAEYRSGRAHGDSRRAGDTFPLCGLGRRC